MTSVRRFFPATLSWGADDTWTEESTTTLTSDPACRPPSMPCAPVLTPAGDNGGIRLGITMVTGSRLTYSAQALIVVLVCPTPARGGLTSGLIRRLVIRRVEAGRVGREAASGFKLSPNCLDSPTVSILQYCHRIHDTV